ncbi:elongator complex protein 6 [Trichomonascus vanleenenianus]|uniref:Elongator subunit ELP6 n=1 Tax=Trichomonascus vanleenenianus TaxID=2268995 RepID=UPI003ECA9CF8
MSKTIAFKDVQFFSDGSIFQPGFCHVVTSTIDVSPVWLSQYICGRLSKDFDGPVCLVTFQDHNELHKKGLKRVGLDLAIVPAHEFQLVDLSGSLVTTRGAATLEQLVSLLQKNVPANAALVIESLDFLGPICGLSAEDLSQLAFSLQKMSRGVYMMCNADEPLIMDTEDSDLADNQANFIVSLLYQSTVSLTLRPLETGRADDVTGVLTVATGARVPLEGVTVVEGEYMYLVTNDSTKIFYR